MAINTVSAKKTKQATGAKKSLNKPRSTFKARAVWAYNPFDVNTKANKNINTLLSQVIDGPAQLSVAYVASPGETDFLRALHIPHSERFTSFPKQVLKKTLKANRVRVQDKNILVAVSKSFSVQKSVDTVLSLAKSQKSNLIVLGTQRKRGIKRLFMGSFAETLVHRSSMSLLVVSPQVKPIKKIKRVFFAHDFSDSLKNDLDQAIGVCKKLNAELIVFHAAEIVYKWSLNESSPQIASYRNKIDKTQDVIAERIQKAGVKCQLIVEAEMRPTSELLLDHAKKAKADMLMLVARAGQATALMGGSVTRQVLRESTKPVYIIK